MSKALKKLREEKKAPERLPHWRKRTPEEIKRETEEARIKEERAKRELENVMSEVFKRSIKLLKEAEKEEQKASEPYYELAKALETLGEHVFATTMRRIASEEETHYRSIKDTITSLKAKEAYKKL